jgi:hypothetical protein
MCPLKIKRQPDTNVDPKQALRAHIDQLPPEKQREFVASALQLIAKRTAMSDAKVGTKVSVWCAGRMS